MERSPNINEMIHHEEKILERKFDEQFERITILEIEGQRCEVFDIIPEHVEDEVPVVFAVGYGATPREYKLLLYELFKSGRRVMAITRPNLSTSQEPSNRKYPPALVLRAEAIKKLCDEKQISQVDVVAHSEGVIHAIIAAGQDSEQFRNFVLVSPPGLTVKSNAEIMARALINKIQNFKRPKVVTGEPKQLNLNKETSTIRKKINELIQAMDPGKIDVTDDLKLLHNLGHGVSIVAGVDDLMLPADDFQREKDGTLRSQESLGVDGFYSVIGVHDELKNNPKIGFLIASALTALATKYEKISSNQSIEEESLI